MDKFAILQKVQQVLSGVSSAAATTFRIDTLRELEARLKADVEAEKTEAKSVNYWNGVYAEAGIVPEAINQWPQRSRIVLEQVGPNKWQRFTTVPGLMLAGGAGVQSRKDAFEAALVAAELIDKRPANTSIETKVDGSGKSPAIEDVGTDWKAAYEERGETIKKIIEKHNNDLLELKRIAQAEYDDWRKQTAERDAEIRRLVDDAKHGIGLIDEARRERDNLAAEIDTLRSEYNDRTLERDEARAQVEQLRQRLAERDARVTRLASEISTQRNELLADADALRHQCNQWIRERDQAIAERDLARNELAAFAADVSDLTSQRDALQAEVDTLKADLSAAVKQRRDALADQMLARHTTNEQGDSRFLAVARHLDLLDERLRNHDKSVQCDLGNLDERLAAVEARLGSIKAI